MTEKARILFVDDEKRVLNSMRGLFRRDFELFLTTEGSDAVRIATENAIDVIVADQRMPGMTGIEVLGKVKELSPRTVRILLTGYADPEAVEGSINIGEVFRFLSKPCPPKVLRETLELAIEASRSAAPAKVEQPASRPPAPKPEVADTPAPATAQPAVDSDISHTDTAAHDAFRKLVVHGEQHDADVVNVGAAFTEIRCPDFLAGVARQDHRRDLLPVR